MTGAAVLPGAAALLVAMQSCLAPTPSVGTLPPVGAVPRLPAGCEELGRLSAADRLLADSLLTEAMDNEALFTIAGSLKPMSTVVDLRSATLRPDSIPRGDGAPHPARRADLERIARLQRVLDALDCGPLDFVVVPFRAVFDTVRHLSAVVVDRQLLDDRLDVHSGFFGHWGLGVGADVGVVVTTVEFEERYDRYRGYGILFGYPDYAVDFFVDAARRGDSVGELIPRDFMRMPVHSGQEGRFVYAVPRGSAERAEDRAIRDEAQAILSSYASRRRGYVDADGYLRAFDLYRDWIVERVEAIAR